MKAGYDLSRLIKFATRDDWRGALDETLDDHVGTAMEKFGIKFKDMGDVLGDHYAGILFGCALEDLMTRRFEPGDLNLIDDYLKRRGWNEQALAKNYMRALRDSACSLYEVSGIVPGESFLARDMVRGGKPVRVNERTATYSLKQWDKIAARIVPERKAHILSGALLPFSQQAADALIGGLRGAKGKRRKTAALDVDDVTLATRAPLFTSAWLFDVLPQALGFETPVIQNSDGDELMFHTIRFPLGTGVTQDVVGRLIGADPSFRRENARFWNWLKLYDDLSDDVPAAKSSDAHKWITTLDDGSTVLGNLELKGRALILSVNSVKRATIGAALLQKLLGDAVGVPLTEIETLEQTAASHDGQPSSQTDIPPEIATELVHTMLNKSYRATLDEPVGMLGNMTPREASQTAKGRNMVVEWLKLLENRGGHQLADDDPMATYDFSWLWSELGVENLRK